MSAHFSLPIPIKLFRRLENLDSESLEQCHHFNAQIPDDNSFYFSFYFIYFFYYYFIFYFWFFFLLLNILLLLDFTVPWCKEGRLWTWSPRRGTWHGGRSSRWWAQSWLYNTKKYRTTVGVRKKSQKRSVFQNTTWILTFPYLPCPCFPSGAISAGGD